MRLIETLEDISDGNMYDIEDVVRADANGCEGCSDCCKDVGDLVVLNPHDVYEMTRYLNKEIDELLEEKVKLRENNKILLPYLNMEENKKCSFLNDDDLCEIHLARPNICRLFPLGRVYQREDIKYFLQVGNCSKNDLKEVKVSEWINIYNYDINKKFILEWYKFIKALTFRLKFTRDEEELRKINNVILNSFYRNNLTKSDFYSNFFKVLPNVKNELGII